MSDYAQRIATILQQLGVDAGYSAQVGIPLQTEAHDLVSVGEDIFGRPQQMTPEAAGQWEKMRCAAAQDGIQLHLVSAFRSVERQQQIIEKKLIKGQSLEEILKVNAAPGYSEHHTGCAIDIHSGEGEPLSTDFENSPAFDWLCDHAAEFGFVLSYPRESTSKITYEPWHWAYHQDSV